MQELGLEDVFQRIGKAFSENRFDVAEGYLWPALDQFPELAGLWFFAGNILHQKGQLEPSALCFQKCLDLDYNPNVLINLGATYRRLNKYDEGIRVLTQAIRDLPDSLDALVNLGGMYVNEGNPRPGIEYLERALALEEKGGKSRAEWNLALLCLEAGDYQRGFDLYRRGIHAERMARMYGYEGAPEPVLYQPGMPREGKTLITWGEQGVGDELMFGSIINDARRDFGEVIFECHPRLEWLHQRAHPGIRTFPTRKLEFIDWPVKEGIRADYKLPVGDLASLYRPDRDSFRKAWAEFGPFYTVDPDETRSYRERLEKQARGRPIVGLAMRGGTFMTAREHRTLSAQEARKIIESTDAMFVGLDYEDMTNFAAWIHQEVGPDRFIWLPSITSSWDYQHHGALAQACDLVVTVCQSIAHLSAAMGLETRVLTPKRVAWRYGLEGEEWYWYGPEARLYRQETPDSWDVPIARVIGDIKC